MADDEVGALPLDPSETSRRIRAAKNYRGDIAWSELADIAGIAKPTLERMTRVVDPQPARPDQLDAIADATGVPRAFMQLGFEPYARLVERRNRAAHYGDLASSKTLTMLFYRVAAIEALLARWMGEDPFSEDDSDLLATWPDPPPDDEAPVRTADTPSPSHRAAADRRRVA